MDAMQWDGWIDGLDGMGCLDGMDVWDGGDGMGWDGMGWDGMGWDGMGWDDLDLSKVYDCISHDLLIAKIEAYGFHRNALKLVYSFLKN